MPAHSAECADAEPGSLCDCDCAGAQHATKRTGGKPAAGRVSERARRLAASQGRPVVTGDGKRGSDGARVKASSKPATLPPPLVAKVAEARKRLPRTREQWNDTTPAAPSPADYARGRVEEWRQRLQVSREREQEIRDRVSNHMKASGHTKRQIDAYLRKIAKPGSGELASAIENVQYAQETLAEYERKLAAADTTPGARQYPRDARGNKMPTPQLYGHLDTVMDVGHAVLGAAREQFDRDPQIVAARQRLAVRADLARRKRELFGDRSLRIAEKVQRREQLRDAEPPGSAHEDQQAVARREQEIIRQLLTSVRPFGGLSHRVDAATAAQLNTMNAASFRTKASSKLSAPPADHREQLAAAEGFYPAAWLRLSADAGPLRTVTTDRAFYSHEEGATLALSATRNDAGYDGGFSDRAAETNVHELGHRMERTVPGLTHLEFALTRRRSTGKDGNLEPRRKIADLRPGHGYDEHEVAHPDDWAEPYTGKTYERGLSDEGPAAEAWELFQVGTQDLYGRGSRRFDTRDDLQAFTIGVLLTLG